MEANERPTKRPDERRACDRPENRDCPSPSRPSVLSLLGRKTVDTVDSGRRRRAAYTWPASPNLMFFHLYY